MGKTDLALQPGDQDAVLMTSVPVIKVFSSWASPVSICSAVQLSTMLSAVLLFQPHMELSRTMSKHCKVSPRIISS